MEYLHCIYLDFYIKTPPFWDYYRFGGIVWRENSFDFETFNIIYNLSSINQSKDMAFFHLSNRQENRKRAFSIDNVEKEEFLHAIERM